MPPPAARRSTATATESDLDRGFRNGRVVGHYLRILGFATLLSTVLNLMAGKDLRLDFTFILFLWLGGGLLRGKEKFRKGVAILLAIYVGVALAMVVLILVIPGGSERVLSQTPDLAALNLGVFLTATGLPLALLAAAATRRAYQSGAPPPVPQPSALRTIYYILGSIILASFPLFIERVTDRTVLRSSTTFPGGSFASVRVDVKTEKGSAPLYIACWALADSNQVGGSGDGRTILFNDVAVPIPHGKPVQFLLAPPLEPRDQANVLIVDEDGTVTRLDRRVTLANLALAESSIQGVKELAEIRERLERALPPLTTAAP